MIDITQLSKKDIGRWVLYCPVGRVPERGKIKSWNDEVIFVVYNANDNWDGDHWKDYTAAATKPEDLKFDGPQQRGFAIMDKDRVRRIAAQGGRTSRRRKYV